MIKQFDPRKTISEDRLAWYKRMRVRFGDLLDVAIETHDSYRIERTAEDCLTLIDEMIETMEMEILAQNQKH